MCVCVDEWVPVYKNLMYIYLFIIHLLIALYTIINIGGYGMTESKYSFFFQVMVKKEKACKNRES